MELSSGNVLEDRGLPDANELDSKVRLAVEINRLIQRQGLTQVTAAARLEVREPRVSALQSYKLEGFAAEDPMSFLRALAKPAQKCSYR